MMKQKAIRLPIELIENAEMLARETPHSASELMRIAMERGFREIMIMREMEVSDLSGIATQIPLLLKQFLYEHTNLSLMIEDVLKQHIPEYEKPYFEGNMNQRIGKKMQEIYFNERDQVKNHDK